MATNLSNEFYEALTPWVQTSLAERAQDLVDPLYVRYLRVPPEASSVVKSVRLAEVVELNVGEDTKRVALFERRPFSGKELGEDDLTDEQRVCDFAFLVRGVSTASLKETEKAFQVGRTNGGLSVDQLRVVEALKPIWGNPDVLESTGIETFSFAPTT